MAESNPDRKRHAPWYRQNLPRQRKNLRLELRLSAFTKLQRLRRSDGAGRCEPLVAVVERLIEQSHELPAALNKSCT